MDSPNVEIVELPDEKWREYRTLRLTALRTDPLAYSSTYDASAGYPDEYWRARLANPGSVILFAECDGRLVGMAAAILGVEGDQATAQIVGVFVEPAQRGRRIGRLLLETLLGRLRERAEITRVRLGVPETQAAAIALYRSRGFVETGRLAGEIRAGERVYDELVMERASG
jgi:ribosomal protein S18 acetylase RimI-like enzyme